MSTSQGEVVCSCPMGGSVTYNVGASLFDDCGFGIGMFIHDANGSFVKAKFFWFLGTLQPQEAKADANEHPLQRNLAEEDANKHPTKVNASHSVKGERDLGESSQESTPGLPRWIPRGSFRNEKAE